MSEMSPSDFLPSLNACRAKVNFSAFNLLMSVVEQAVYGEPLTRDSVVIKQLYVFLESKCCYIDVDLDAILK